MGKDRGISIKDPKIYIHGKAIRPSSMMLNRKAKYEI
jgi:hypothetical protein